MRFHRHNCTSKSKHANRKDHQNKLITTARSTLHPNETMENELLRSRLSIRISPRSEESTRTSESATLRGTRRHEAGLFTIYEDNSDETTTKEAKGMEPLQEKGGPIMARGEWVEDVLAEFLGSGSGDEISGMNLPLKLIVSALSVALASA